ncbi:N-acetylmuramoyl-L-alanine amidase A [Nocardioides aquaticus]|uniref:N-acetylmuramoyl-L-alanine amidase n=2 Tax=Nocardioides aquaticus TaxID=160826 RepID=A0ABX8ENM8_9ACTN|nr:N-acetylmuramoyl-L-alanine amidase [Nocardioides aquaticus]QVT80717.1 N-acetylmuramoyl-L-alanine amidase A [Nocardioides aquaticus]
MLGSPRSQGLHSARRRTAVGLGLTGLVASTLGAVTLASAPGPSAAAGPSTADWAACAAPAPSRQAAFARAAEVSGVPEEVLLGVSYLQSRWDDHGTSPSTSGGYGPLHLTAVESTPAALTDPDPLGKGEGGPEPGSREMTTSRMDDTQLRTLDRAADLTGLPADRLEADDVANICGGAALLAADQRASGVEARDLGDWSAAVAAYSRAADEATALRFARDVFAVIRSGEARRTNDGERVRLPATAARVDPAAVAALDLAQAGPATADCNARLACASVPAPYEQYGETPGEYGNHDLADRPEDLDLDYLVIHDTEATWDTTLDLVTDPTYVSWHYSLRSADGHIAQHVPVDDPAWHAGNWYVNMHSIGLEHEGFAAEGASWYTENLYRTSARLVRHLGERYDIPLDRGHVIGHDQVPGTTPATVRGMHWDPGPYWDWEHYFDLLRAPIDQTGAAARGRGARDARVVTVAPGFRGNRQPLSGCTESGACRPQATNFVPLQQRPRWGSPLVADAGLRPDGSPSTTQVSDIGARATAGHRFRVAERRGAWLGVWYLGDLAWMHSPRKDPVVVPDRARVVVPRRDDVPVYGRAYPEESAYPASIPVQEVVPLQYTMDRGQGYVVADADPETDYYYAKSFQCATTVDDCTEVEGADDYLMVWFGHRMAYVRADDVRVRTVGGTLR